MPVKFAWDLNHLQSILPYIFYTQFLKWRLIFGWKLLNSVLNHLFLSDCQKYLTYLTIYKIPYSDLMCVAVISAENRFDMPSSNSSRGCCVRFHKKSWNPEKDKTSSFLPQPQQGVNNKVDGTFYLWLVISIGKLKSKTVGMGLPILTNSNNTWCNEAVVLYSIMPDFSRQYSKKYIYIKIYLDSVFWSRSFCAFIIWNSNMRGTESYMPSDMVVSSRQKILQLC